MRALEHEQRLAARERETLEAAEGRMRQREDALKQREETFRRRLNEELETEVRRARREIDDVIAGLKTQDDDHRARGAGRRWRRPSAPARPARPARDARAALDSVVERFLAPVSEAPEPAPTPGRTPAVGDRVVVSGLGLEAIVTAIHDGSADLDVRGKRMRASVRDLRVVGAAPAGSARVNVHVELQPREGNADGPQRHRLHRRRSDRASQRFLDESLLTDLRVVRLIHGYGTGQLKRALAGFLQQHPLVARFAAAPPEQGGGGVTVVELKE